MKVALTHVYSRVNAGDGLLVDLSLDRLRRAGVFPEDVVLVALDPHSFNHPGGCVGVGTPGRSPAAAAFAATQSAAALSEVVVPVNRTALTRCLAESEAIVGVGGGYLRSPDAVSAVGTVINHLPQLVLAGRRPVPSVMLPQSIGPLRGPVGRLVRHALRGFDLVCVRDPWSAAELSGRVRHREVPDLAVLDIAERWPFEVVDRPDGAVVIAPRRVDHSPGYFDELHAAAAALGDRALWAVQAGGTSEKSDGAYLERMGIEPAGLLSDAISGGHASCVVSVRLHGALAAVRAGIPAVHLAYDRKGPAAFTALGLERYCIDVRSLREPNLSSLVRSVLTDPGTYWSAMREKVPSLRAHGEILDATLRELFDRAQT